MDRAELEDPLIARCKAEADTLAELRCALRNKLARSGLEDVQIPEQLQSCTLAKDPFDGSTSLIGEWRSGRGKALGSIVIHESGQLLAELYIAEPLPNDATWLVDSVEAFGTSGQVRAALRLVPALG